MKKWLVIFIGILFLAGFGFLKSALAQSKVIMSSVLSDESLTPSWTWPGGEITFSVSFSDPKNRTPDSVTVHIDEKSYPMTKKDSRYEYKWSPTGGQLGSHAYFFEAKVDSEKTRLPDFEDGTYGGPYVFATKEPFVDFQVLLFKKDSDKPVWTYSANGLIRALAFSKDGKYLVAGVKGNVILFDTQKNQPLWEYKLGMSVRSVSISSEGNYIIAGSIDGKIGFFEKSKKEPIWTFQTNQVVLNTSISSDGQYMTVGGDKLYLFERKSNKPLWTYQPGNDGGTFFSVPISSDGNYIAAGFGNKIALFERKSNKPLWTFQSGGTFESVTISDDGSYVTGGTHCPERKMFVFKRESKEPLWQKVVHDQAPPFVVSSSSDLKRIAVAIDGGSETYSNFYLFDRETEKPIWDYNYQNNPFNASAVSSDGKYIVGGAGDGSVFLWDDQSKEPIWQAKTNQVIGSVAISQNGEFIAAGHSLPYQWFFEEEMPQREGVEREGVRKEGKPELQKPFYLLKFRFGFLIFSFLILVTTIILAIKKKLKKWLLILFVILFLGGIVGFFQTSRATFKLQKEKEGTPTKTEEQAPKAGQEQIPSKEEGGPSAPPGEAKCGDGLCEPQKGEDRNNCPKDCTGSPIE